MASAIRNPTTRDDGVVLVLWALFLPLLAGLMVGVIWLGNLLQSADNAENAADAAALAAAGYLVQQDYPPPLVVTNIPDILGYECQVGASNTITTCAHSNYGWLYGYSIYEAGTWNAIWTANEAEQALREAGTAWTCQGQAMLPSSHHHHGPLYCTGINIRPPAWGYGVDGSLSDNATISEVAGATATAITVEVKYGFTSYSGCTPPQNFLLAEGSGASCIGYDAAGIIWVSVPDQPGSPGSPAPGEKTWATAAEVPAVLCPGPPPSGSCS